MRLILDPRVNARACLVTGRVTGALRELRGTSIPRRGGCAHALVHWAPGVNPFSFRIENFWGHCCSLAAPKMGVVGCALDIFRAFSRTREAAALNLLEGSFPRTEEKRPLSPHMPDECLAARRSQSGQRLVKAWRSRRSA